MYYIVHMPAILYTIIIGCEITDEEAEKIFNAQDAIELLKTKLDVH